MAGVVRVLTEVAPLERGFDYLDGGLALALGDRVRVALGPRSVRGWVIDADLAEPERGPETLRAVTASLGLGPPASVIELARWAAWRWCAPWGHFLSTASPARIVRELPVAPAPAPTPPRRRWEPGLYHLAPTTDPLDLVLSAYEAARPREGSLLVVVPHEGWAERLAARLARRGVAVAREDWARARAGWPVVVGTRAAAFAPVPRLAGAVVLDADDDALVSSAAPTWDAPTVVAERCRRDGAPLWVGALWPAPGLVGRGDYRRDPDLVGGWPRVVVLDRRDRDPHEGALAPAVLEAARRALAGDEPVALAVVHQRLGAGRLLACRRCGALVRCPVCGQAEGEANDALRCPSGHARARFCAACASTALRRVRSGVTTLARDVAAQLGVAVAEVTAARPYDGATRVVVGTEALFASVRRAGVVCVADADQYLLAPRSAARRQFVHALGRAGRLVGPRREGRAAIYVQTRRGDDPVLEAVVAARFDDLVAEEAAEARLLGLAPYGGEARLSGDGAAELAGELGARGVSVREGAGGFIARARDVATLCDALAACASRRRCRVAVAGGDG
ncbi:MAG TPA: hypothetical protein PLS29_04300 [Acidimicrobiales bacterium]|nr:MAG: hypothetical protein B7Z69_05975 [Actinobacteria bacterium 21-73-9]HQU26235.1 hypothetical protein [Acidimicrobiales bacterium]